MPSWFKNVVPRGLFLETPGKQNYGSSNTKAEKICLLRNIKEQQKKGLLKRSPPLTKAEPSRYLPRRSSLRTAPATGGPAPMDVSFHTRNFQISLKTTGVMCFEREKAQNPFPKGRFCRQAKGKGETAVARMKPKAEGPSKFLPWEWTRRAWQAPAAGEHRSAWLQFERHVFHV